MLDRRRGVDRETRQRIRGWVRELRRLPDAANVSVHELRCDEPGCPDVETVVLIGLGSHRTVQHKIRKPAVEVTRDDLDRALEP